VLLLATLIGCGSGTNSDSSFSNNGGSNTPPPPPSLLVQLSTDSFSNASSQHATEVEPSIAAFGSTLVSVFQMGRFFNGGASDIGFATSLDSGASWRNGTLPGTTIYAGGTYAAISDPAVVYDRAHTTWLITSLAVLSNSDAVVVSRSSDGVSWGNPITVGNTPDADKNWIACDNNQSSPFYGHCYVIWDDPSNNGLIRMSTSSDGGQTWSVAAAPADNATGLGGVPVVQPNGTVIVPASDDAGTHMIDFTSTDGGLSWTASTVLATISDHQVAGNLREDALPMSAIDANGLVYVVWSDCRFRSGCSSNDIVMSTSSDGVKWSDPARIPIDTVTSTVDHFLPVIAVDPATAGSSAHVTLVYHYYPNASCSEADCALDVAYVTSRDGGNTWSAPNVLAGPMTIDWLANTKIGRMVGDYVGVAYSSGNAYPAIAIARANTGSTFDEAIYSTTNPLTQAVAVASMQRERPVPGAHSDHGPRESYDEEGRYPRKPPISKRRVRRSK
jgi:hypothetical protein